MRKQTIALTRKHRKASSSESSGLIANEKNSKRSAVAKPTLDNRSHRTITGFQAGGAVETLSSWFSEQLLSCDGANKKGPRACAV